MARIKVLPLPLADNNGQVETASDNRTPIIWGMVLVTITVGLFAWFIFSGVQTRGTKTLLRNILIGCS